MVNSQVFGESEVILLKVVRWHFCQVYNIFSIKISNLFEIVLKIEK